MRPPKRERLRRHRHRRGQRRLRTAATAQRAGARTLLLERHNVAGGCGTSFRRGCFEFEVAPHQLWGAGVEA
ncbi:NAD(P)-binding protein [Nocardia sp. NPDC049707]|uniref:NAD(P)-binding protein n=1 Tax=Nocardia sp. NPDC049707 TaxID=3154735 RepID=UPI003443757E